ncbi:collectrin-like [Acipenser ruthenus]|uniref:collectrin-like n=1 Tax=Acipenser ruthenus TaxID=7906 RepID=UPI00156138D1|nr:collectrin-like [Acipenser ruthenus]
MLARVLLALSLVPALALALCQPDGQDAYKVRLSIKTALGANAYEWNESEQFLFRATLAFAMRKYTGQETFNVSSVIVCDETPRVSFWFVVTNPNNTATLIPKNAVEEAVRLSRNRINSAFLLSDKTLQFLGIPPTLAPPSQPSLPVWLIVFGVVMGIVTTGILALIIIGFIQRKKKEKTIEDEDEEEKQERIMENGISCETLEGKDGVNNGAYSHDEDRLTQL